jgi:hypothetical protein
VSNTIIHTVATSYPREMLSTLAFQAGNLALPMENHRALQLRDSAGLRPAFPIVTRASGLWVTWND